MTFENTHNH